MDLEKTQTQQLEGNIDYRVDIHAHRNIFAARMKHISASGDLELERFGYRNDSEEGGYDGSPQWMEEHTAVTPNGSIVAGVLHDYASPETRHMIDEKVLPHIIEKAKKASSIGKKVVFMAEGEIHGPKGSEQEIIANALDREVGNIIHDTWDDGSVDIFSRDQNREHIGINQSSPTVRKLAVKFGSVDTVEAALYASMFGQGEKLSVSTNAERHLREMGIDPKDQDALYRAAHESGEVLATIVNEWNRLRQENLLRKVRAIEQAGNIAIVTPGASHVFSCKEILENHMHEIA